MQSTALDPEGSYSLTLHKDWDPQSNHLAVSKFKSVFNKLGFSIELSALAPDSGAKLNSSWHRLLVLARIQFDVFPIMLSCFFNCTEESANI